MRALFIGDIVGEPGREIVRKMLPTLIRERGIDFVVANGENAAAGFGITPKIAEDLFACGIDVITGGNHLWDKKEIMEYIPRQQRLLRAANYPSTVPGNGSIVLSLPGRGMKIGVLHLICRTFMPTVDCPFQIGRKEVEKMRSETPIILVDLHGEATSEKQALGWYLDGEVSAIVGTHTHVQTADERILPGGTAYLTDLGMTGPYDSVIGIKKESAIERFLTAMPRRFETAAGPAQLCGAVVDIAPGTGLARSIERIFLREGQ